MSTTSMRVNAAFTAYYDSKRTRAKVAAMGMPNRRHAPGKNTLEARERHLRHLHDLLQAESVTHIGLMTQFHVDSAFEDCVESIVPRLDETPSPNTLKLAASSFRNFIKWQALRGTIPARQVYFLLENLPSYDAYKRRMLIIPGEAWPEIFTLAHKRHWVDRMLLELAYRLAMRISEALTVRWCDFSPDFSEVQFYRDKRNDTLTFQTPDLLQDTLRGYHQWLKDTGCEPKPTDPIVVTRTRARPGMARKVDPTWPIQPGVPMNYNTARAALREALVDYGIKPSEMICQGMHIARRSRACALYRQGVDIRIIARILGHKSFITTLDYIRDGLDEEEVKAAMNLPDKPVQDLELFIPAERGGNVNLPGVPQTKEGVAQALLVMLNSGLLSEDEGRILMMRVLT